MIGPITRGMKQAGKRSAGKLHAAFDVAGAGNVTMVVRTAVHHESDGITTGAYRARACSRPYLREPRGAIPRGYSPGSCEESSSRPEKKISRDVLQHWQ